MVFLQATGSRAMCMAINRYILLPFFMCFLAGYSDAAHAIDCTTVATEREKAVCQSDGLLALDAMLNKAYGEALTLETNPREGDKDRNLRREQLAWIRAADGCNSDVPCIREVYASRYVALRAYSDPGFADMEGLTGLADVLETWAATDPSTGGVPLAVRSDAGDTYLIAVPVSWGKPYPYYEVYFMQRGKNPERITFPDLRVEQDMVKEAKSGKFAIEDLTVTTGAQFQSVSFVGRDVVSKAMTGGAGGEWIYRRWRMDWTGAYGVSPALTDYEIENVRDGFTVKVVGAPDR
tara:strand:- start:3645 stop:4523 length:879 start_codon:yes stop_codon:yes gene_type:complete